MGKQNNNKLFAPAAIFYSSDVNQYILKYNPDSLGSYELSEQIVIIIHEILHVVNMHHIRIKYRNLARWNIATDLSINSYLKSKFSKRLLQTLLLPEVFNLPQNMSADWYYESLQDKNIEAFVSHPQWDSYSEVDTIETILRKAEEISKPEISEPTKQIDWSILLKRYVHTFLSPSKGFSYRRISRRFGLPPGKKRFRKIPPIVVALDVSGSILPEYFQKFLKEVRAIGASYAAPIQIVECDHQIVNTYLFNKDRFLDIKNNNGGTKFKPVFELVDTLHKKEGVGCVIYFTDGQADDLDEIHKPKYPVIWVYPQKLCSPCVSWGSNLWM